MKRPFFHCLFIILLGLAVYSNTFHAPFHFDDFQTIVENPGIKDLHTFIGGEELKNTRFIALLTFALNYKLHGLAVIGYHVFNLLVHIINGLLVYFLINLTFRTDRMRPSVHGPRTGALTALFAALLFVAHPVQTQAVTYITQRFASLATMFYLLSLVLYIKARTGRVQDGTGSRVFTAVSIPFYLLSIVSAVLAMKTKEIAFTLPVVVTLYEFTFLNGRIKRRIIFLLPFFLTMLIIPITLLGVDKPVGEIIGDVSGATRVHTALSRTDYLFTQFRVIVTYVRLLLLPVNQNLDYDYPVFGSFFDVQVLLSFLSLASLLGLGVYLLYRYRRPNPDTTPPSPYSRLVSFGIFWFFITLSVESSLIPIADVMFEHRVYLPSTGFLILIVSLTHILKNKLEGKTPFGERRLALVMIPVVITLSVASYARNLVWTDTVTLWLDAVEKSPRNARAHNNLGNAYFKRNLMDEASAEYRIAIELDPNYPEAHHNLGDLYFAVGLMDDALDAYRVASNLAPDHAEARNNLGAVYFRQNRMDAAQKHFQAAFEIDPYHIEARSNVAFIHHRQGRLDDALKEYQTVLRLDADNYRAHYNMGVIYFKQGRMNEAAEELLAVIRLNPTYAKAHYSLGTVYLKLGLIHKAVGELRAALRLNPTYAKAHYNLGAAYSRMGRTDEALKEYQEALRLKSDYAATPRTRRADTERPAGGASDIDLQ